MQRSENEAGSAAPHDTKLWFYEYLDHIANTELKAKSAVQGATQIRYAAGMVTGAVGLFLNE